MEIVRNWGFSTENWSRLVHIMFVLLGKDPKNHNQITVTDARMWQLWQDHLENIRCVIHALNNYADNSFEPKCGYVFSLFLGVEYWGHSSIKLSEFTEIQILVFYCDNNGYKHFDILSNNTELISWSPHTRMRKWACFLRW